MTHQLKISFGHKEPEQRSETQLSLADYWEHIHSPDEREIMEEPVISNIPHTAPFDFKLRRRRPLWRDMAAFGATSLIMWGISHVVLNFSAFAEITEYRAKNLTASVIDAFEPKAPTPLTLDTTGVPRTEKSEKTHIAEVFESWDVHPSDDRLVIPRIEKNVPLVTVPSHQNWKQLETNIQKGLQQGVVIHPVSHSPESMGNFFLTGHSSYYAWDKGRYKDVFALLHEVQEGDIAEVYWHGKKYVYELTQSAIIPPTDTSVLKQPNDRRIITLMTCTPVGTNKNRLIWTGELIRVE
jgi:LPXTG-site transpeptidase (sortase) family protein